MLSLEVDPEAGLGAGAPRALSGRPEPRAARDAAARAGARREGGRPPAAGAPRAPAARRRPRAAARAAAPRCCPSSCWPTTGRPRRDAPTCARLAASAAAPPRQASLFDGADGPAGAGRRMSGARSRCAGADRSPQPRSVTLASAIDFDGFRARLPRARGPTQVAPDRVSWHTADDAERDLFEPTASAGGAAAGRGAARRRRSACRRRSCRSARASSCTATPAASACSTACSGACSASRRCATTRSIPTGCGADADGAGGAARHAQDEGVRALPRRSPTATTAARRCTSPGSSPSTTSSRRRRRSSRAASPACAGRS